MPTIRQWPEVYDLCHTFFACCASQKTYGHARIARDTRMADGLTCQNVLQNLIPLATAYLPYREESTQNCLRKRTDMMTLCNGGITPNLILNFHRTIFLVMDVTIGHTYSSLLEPC